MNSSFFWKIGLLMLFFVAGIKTVCAIDDVEMDKFLFKINDDLKSRVVLLGDTPVENLFIPVLGVSLSELEDSWGEPRSGGTVHLGIDIMAPRGAIIVSPTKAVVTNVGYDSKGGNYVITANPGGRQLYYAHLDKAAANIRPGSELEVGDIIGYVGNTGNAQGRMAHLHLGIYYKGEAMNPYPRLTREFSSKEKEEILVRVCFEQGDMDIGSEGGCVRSLQQFLIDKASGSSAQLLASAGPTGYFGSVTRAALAEYQLASGIVPASGYFGSITREHIVVVLSAHSVPSEAAPDLAVSESNTKLNNIGSQLASISEIVAQLAESARELVNR